MHIDYSTLSAFADGDLDPTLSEAVSAHLHVCARCRAEVQFIRSLGDGLRALQSPLAPRDACDGIWPEEREAVPTLRLRLKRRQPVRRGLLLALAASVVALMAAGLVLTVGADRAMAGSSTLTLERAEGGAMTLRYVTVSPLAAETSVRARIRYWIPDPVRFSQNEGGFSEIELSREAPGRFDGIVDLPPGTVYAAAAVEDLGGTYLDSDFGRFWEYVETDAEGRPTLEARRYQILAALEFNVPRAALLAEEAASEFPEQPLFSFWRLFLNATAFTEVTSDSLLATHAARLEVFDRTAREGDPGPAEIDGLSRYARLLGRTDLADYWWDELGARYPRHDATAQVNLQRILPLEASTSEKLEALEADWVRVGVPITAQLGLRYSYELADPRVTERWLTRHEASSWGRDLSSDTEVARRLVDAPTLWTLAERWILDRLSLSYDWVGPARRLDQSRSNFDVEARQNRAYLYLYLARIRLGQGDVVGGVDALERSVKEAWNPAVFARAAEIHRSLGAHVRAAQLLSLVQVDPVVPLEPYLPSAAYVPPHSPADTDLATARAAMQERIVAGLLDELVTLNVSLRTEAGDETTLRQAAGPGRGVTLIIYTMRPDLAPGDAVGLLDLNSERLGSAGVRTVFISQQPDPSQEGSHGIDSELHIDPDYQVWEALGAWRSLQYFVLDRSGRLRHRGEGLETALRISLALTM
ncbi:zf-HC2 domain-containing protein [Candidatus Palauibacter sp.]|uniref:zf-HC2 domain-containing protein n=1 Tax=Candidatus Palauibacter sp. TaxID=3101350 RepID=UPI003B01844B